MKTNVFEKEKHPDLWESALRKCQREEADARTTVEEALKNDLQKDFADQCSRNASYVRLIRCMASKAEKRDEQDRVVRYFMALDAKNEAVPQVSVDGTCRRRSVDEGEAAYHACMEDQQRSYDFLKPLWPHLPRQIALNCRWILFEYADGSKQMNPDYSVVRSCIWHEMKKAMQGASREERMNALPRKELKY
jgi:hypothetical protein